MILQVVPLFNAFALQKMNKKECVVVVYHVTIVAFGHGLLKKFWPFLEIG